jgi:very-short-patch-repair endonuclease/predicted transcriptional regulator of viral defense system
VGELRGIRNGSSDANSKVRLAAVAQRQFGRVRRDQLGVSRTTIARWVDSGYLHPELPGVYAVGHAARTAESKLAAAVLYAGRGAGLSHGTAAFWWGLIKYPPPLIHVSTPGYRRSRDGIRVHQRRNVERVQRNGLPVTTVAQTLIDFAADGEHDLLRFALANADYHRLLNIAAVEAIRHRGVPGSARLRAALAVHRPELAYTRSEIERLLIELCESHRLPLPKLNVYRRGWLVDAAWDEQRLIVELDGYNSHRTKAQLESDHKRDLELRAAGYTVLRYTWRQLTETPDAVAHDIYRHLGA